MISEVYDARSFHECLHSILEGDESETFTYPFFQLVWVLMRHSWPAADEDKIVEAFKKSLVKKVHDEENDLVVAFQNLAIELVPIAIAAIRETIPGDRPTNKGPDCGQPVEAS